MNDLLLQLKKELQRDIAKTLSEMSREEKSNLTLCFSQERDFLAKQQKLSKSA